MKEITELSDVTDFIYSKIASTSQAISKADIWYVLHQAEKLGFINRPPNNTVELRQPKQCEKYEREKNCCGVWCTDYPTAE